MYKLMCIVIGLGNTVTDRLQSFQHTAIVAQVQNQNGTQQIRNFVVNIHAIVPSSQIHSHALGIKQCFLSVVYCIQILIHFAFNFLSLMQHLGIVKR